LAVSPVPNIDLSSAEPFPSCNHIFFIKSTSVIIVKPAKSYRFLEEAFRHQNAGKPPGNRLKSGHLEMMKVIIRLWQKETGKYQQQGYRATPRSTNTLRTLRTNSKQLHKMTHRCVRTVRNLLNRLEAFGWLKKTFHGSNASFELAINLDLLYLQDTNAANAGNVAGKFDNPLPSLRQFLPHTLSRVTRQVTNKLNELGSLASDDEPATASAAPSPSAGGNQPEIEAGYHPSSEAPPRKKQATLPLQKSSAKKVPPPHRPETMEEVAAHLSERDRQRLPRHLDTVWRYAFSELAEWMPGYLVPSEVARGRVALAEFFVYGNPASWNAATEEFLHRIDLFVGECERRTAAGKKAFIVIPSLWFDIRNPNGFARSKGWFKTEQSKRKEWNIRSVIGKQLTRYRRAQDSVSGNSEDTLRSIRQYLEKRGGPALFARFTAKLNAADSSLAGA
jgi:hypothetical protein